MNKYSSLLLIMVNRNKQTLHCLTKSHNIKLVTSIISIYNATIFFLVNEIWNQYSHFIPYYNNYFEYSDVSLPATKVPYFPTLTLLAENCFKPLMKTVYDIVIVVFQNNSVNLMCHGG